MPFRIVVYTAAAHAEHVQRTVASLANIPDVEILVLQHRPIRRLAKLVRNQFRNVSRHGWRWLPYQLAEIFRHRSERGLRSSRADAPRVRSETVVSVNSQESVRLVRDWRPDLGLSLAAPILLERQFSIPRLGTLNIHKGKLPEYRGMPPAFWELWNGETEVGVTVHRVASQLDAGDVLIERRVEIEPFSTPAGLRLHLDDIGVKLMVEAVALIRADKAIFSPQYGEAKTFSRPTLKQENMLARRIKPLDPKRQLKNLIFNAYGTIGQRLPASSGRIVIFLYHRVNDTHRDAVTIGIEQFAIQMQYLRDHYNIVSLRDILGGRIDRQSANVAVTFDDGYLDNYTNAAKILTKFDIPATFFVSTDNVEVGRPFDHDLRKLGKGLPNMNWDQIREMHREGLHFGSHTANHINLATTDAQTVALELERSKNALERELGLTEVMFAHPFGKRKDITAERLQQVKDAGYICNCSAYGGINGADIDRWDIRRQGIDHSFDVPALRAKIAGWKSNSYA